MSTETTIDTGASTSNRAGAIIALGYSAELINNVGKETHPQATITRFGIPGDRHYGETRMSRGRAIPNNRPITIVGVEGVRDACERLGIPQVPPGGLGENMLVEGLGDLSEIGPGDQVRVLDENGEPNVVFEVYKQNDPCVNLQIYHKGMVKELYGKRGLLCTVLVEGTVRVGDTVDVVREA